MKQTSEAAVQPRRNVLSALWVAIMGLWGATMPAWGMSRPKAVMAPSEGELAMLVARLCMDTDFRTSYFGAKSDDDAIEYAKGKGMSLGKDKTKEAVRKMRAAPHKSPNPVDDACAEVYKQLSNAAISLPCNPWPC